MDLQNLNSLSQSAAFEELFKCCGCTRWAQQVAYNIPYRNKEELFSYADEVWDDCTEEDGLEAFSHHPKIGNLKNLEKKFAATKDWAGNEQAGVNDARQHTLQSLAIGNEKYESKFGYIFIVCATGKSAGEMLELLNSRMNNEPEEEFKIAMGEQSKITKIRLEKLLE